MNLTTSDLSDLADIAIEAATKAGQMILRSRPDVVERKDGADSLAAQVVTEIDRRGEAIIVDIVGPSIERFELGMLTEEQDDDGTRLSADYFWCIDPLDGTLPYIEGSPGYAVSIALVARDGTPQIGVVYDPVDEVLLHAVSNAGAFRNRRRWLADRSDRRNILSVFADRSFAAGEDHVVVVEALGQVARDMGLTGLELHTTGGAVMNACGVLANAPGCYFKNPKPTGGGSVWDFAATACLFHELGAVATDRGGRPLELNRTDATSMNHRGVLFATDEELAARLRNLPQTRQ